MWESIFLPGELGCWGMYMQTPSLECMLPFAPGNAEPREGICSMSKKETLHAKMCPCRERAMHVPKITRV